MRPVVASLLAAVALASPSSAQEPQLASVPLPARAAAGGPLFERLDAERSGIDFVHARPHDPEYAHILGNALFGGGVAVGDADGDGLADLLFTRAAGGQRFYRNLGGIQFEEATDERGLRDESWGNGAAFADVDGDGDLDLAVCGYERPNRLWIQGPDGTFAERAAQAGLDFAGASIALAFADYDSDGDVDGYLLTNRHASREIMDREPYLVDGRLAVPEDLREQFMVVTRPTGAIYALAGQADHLYRNDGTGSFTDVSESAGIAGFDLGLSATWWDYDGDGHPDLYVANDFFGPDHLYHNQGDGTFVDIATSALPQTPWFSMGSDAADVDGDGRLDLLATDMLPITRHGRHVGLGDVADAEWFPETSLPSQAMRNALYRNTGTARFQEVAWMAGLAATDWTWSASFGDLDEDGWVDLFVSNGMTRDFFNTDLRGEGRQRMADLSDMKDFWEPRPPLVQKNLAFRNEGDLRFTPVGPAWGLDALGVSFGAGLADLDGDGDLDVVSNDFEAPAGVWKNRTASGHRIVLRLEASASAPLGLGARVELETPDGRLQVREVALSHGFQFSGDGSLHFGLGAHEVARRLVVRWPSGRRTLLADVAADRRYVLSEPEAPPAGESLPTPAGPVAADDPPLPAVPVFTRRESPFRIVDLPTPEFARQPLLPWRLSQEGPGVAVGDVDGDRDDDVLIGGPAGHPTLLFLGDGNGLFDLLPSKAFEVDAAHEDAAPLFLDVDGDRDLDLYLASGGVEHVPGAPLLRDRLYLNDGTGSFSRAPEGALPGYADVGSVAAAADFDRDGDLDLFVGSRALPGAWPASPESRLLRNDRGRFTLVGEGGAGGLARTGMVTSALWSDVDGDLWPDLLVAHELGPIRLWRNRQGRLVDDSEAAGLSALTGLWNGLAAADFDGDGDTDFAAGNLGLNTRYRQGPVEVLYGDFDGAGSRHVLEVEREGDALHPLRCRACALRAWPFVAAQFPTWDAWGRATLEDFADPDGLAAALRLAAVELRSGVFWNDGQGRFAFRALPRGAQLAPAYGVAATELDGDGRPDLVLVQNSLAPHVEIGRFTGGTGALLLGQPDGNFVLADPARTHFVVEGQGRGLAVLDIEGSNWPELFVGTNDGPFLLFVHSGIPGRRIFSVRLVGRPPNVQAVGARITLERDDGLVQTHEVSAGGGWLSQSVGTAFFGLGETARAAKLSVRWPDGTQNEFLPGENDWVIVITQS